MSLNEALSKNPLEEHFARARALTQKLKESPVYTVLGVVGGSGSGGANNPKEDFWTLRFEFENWKFKDEALQNKKLSIQKQLSKEALGEMMEVIKAYDVIEISAHLTEDAASSKSQGLLLKIITKDSTDFDLNRIAQELKEPVLFEDTQFGKFQLDRRINWFEVRTTWISDEIKLRFDSEDLANPNDALVTARALWEQSASWDQRIRDCAVSKLLGIKNDSWRENGDAKITAEQFKARMALESITVSPCGSFEFWFDDGDLFWGHSILVEGTLIDGPSDASFHG